MKLIGFLSKHKFWKIELILCIDFCLLKAGWGGRVSSLLYVRTNSYGQQSCS